MTDPSNLPPNSILALDFGLRRIGVATGTTVTGTASALTTLSAVDGTPDWAELDGIVTEWAPDRLVVGLPFNADGSESEMTGLAREFAARLETRYRKPAELLDERYTSAEAATLLKEQRRTGVRKRRLKKENIDSLAAQLIAESWMRSNQNRS